MSDFAKPLRDENAKLCAEVSASAVLLASARKRAVDLDDENTRLVTENLELRAEVERLKGENRKLDAEVGEVLNRLQAAHEERDQLRAAIADTGGNVMRVAQVLSERNGGFPDQYVGHARDILAAIRARAASEPSDRREAREQRLRAAGFEEVCLCPFPRTDCPNCGLACLACDPGATKGGE